MLSPWLQEIETNHLACRFISSDSQKISHKLSYTDGAKEIMACTENQCSRVSDTCVVQRLSHAVHLTPVYSSSMLYRTGIGPMNENRLNDTIPQLFTANHLSTDRDRTQAERKLERSILSIPAINCTVH